MRSIRRCQVTRKSNQAVLVTRWCPKCGCDTPHYTRGRACQPCRARQSREKYAADIEAGREKSRESTRRRRVADPEKFRVKQRARNGLPGPTRPCPEFCEWPGCTRKAECLDHCHDTDAFRGWLCHTHNRGFGPDRRHDRGHARRCGLSDTRRVRDVVVHPRLRLTNFKRSRLSGYSSFGLHRQSGCGSLL